MDRRLLFPAIAMTAWGQQTSPAAAEAEKALHARVDEFYQLEVAGKFRAAEGLVAEESKDYFYNANKPKLESVVYGSAEFSDNYTRARVTAKAKTQVFFPGVGAQVFETPLASNWELKNGQWWWFFDKDAALNTPFGRMNPGPEASDRQGINSLGTIPDLDALRKQVTISRQDVSLTEADPVQTLTITNHMAGPITLEVRSTKMDGATVELEKSQLAAGETGGMRFRLTGKTKVSGTVQVICSPIGATFDVSISGN